MENEKRINWLSLFIKIVIIFVFLLIIIWLISKIVGKGKLSETFINNITNIEKVSVEYFKTIDLPLEKGQSVKITLEELIENKLISFEGNDLQNSCNLKESYSKITREKDKYIVNTTLDCRKENDTIEREFLLEDCINCNQGTNNESNNNNANSESTVSKVTYYEYTKETIEYTKWMRGSLTGNNIENKYKYYGVDYQTYYTLGVIPSNKKTITYTLKLSNIPNEKYYFTTTKEVNNFNAEEESRYLNEKNVSLYKGDETNIPKTNINKYSLGESNFTYKLSPYYREGSFYIRVTITVNNTNGVNTYYDNKLQKHAYLIPLKVNIKFASNEIKDTKPNGEYETISYYRYVITNRETIWSTEKEVAGYKKTGNTKVQ